MKNRIKKASRTLREERTSYGESVELPWRKKPTPYRIFLAELLLVRTRSDVVASLFEGIYSKYPDAFTLANAKENDLVEDLKPLGLQKRVPYLIKAAEHIVTNHGGNIPRNIEELIEVPGIGLYTSVAIAAFAFGSDVVPADVNILRFLSRLTGLPMEHPTKGSTDLRNLLPLLSKSSGGPKPEKLLDFTRLICLPRTPKCEQCPLTTHCHYYKTLRSDNI